MHGERAVSGPAEETLAIQELGQFLAALGQGELEPMLHAAAERARLTFDAIAAAVAIDGRVAAWARARGAASALEETGADELAGAGDYAVGRAALPGHPRSELFVVRDREAPLALGERQLLETMSGILALRVGAVRALEAERLVRRDSEAQASANAELTRSLREREQLFARLARIERSIVQHARLDDVLLAIVDGASALLDSDIACLNMLDPDDRGWMIMRASRGLDDATLRQLGRRPRDPALPAGRAIIEERLVIANDIVSANAGDQRLGPRWLQAAMAAPVVEHGTVVGSLDVSTFRAGRRYSESEGEALMAFAEHASLALMDAKTFEATVHRSLHDPLTELPNRELLGDRLDQALRRSKRSGRVAAILYIDLDGFKRVNDSLGHPVGDSVLAAVAKRIMSSLRPGDTAARFGGDEFVVLLDDVASPQEATLVADRILEALASPIELGGTRMTVGASIGIAAHEAEADELLRDADLAMYQAKARGKRRRELYRPEMRTVMLERIQLEAEMAQALGNGQIEIFYQPIVAIDSGALVAIEALLRWRHPQRGLLLPRSFVQIAEETGMIVPIGRFVLEQACRRGAAWRERHPSSAPLAVAVNLSAAQLEEEHVVDDVRAALAGAALDPRALILEVGETLLMADGAESRLLGLDELGVQIALDDFGTGYSSLEYLRRFPIDILKMARPFVDGPSSSADAALAQAIVDLGENLELTVIAEGVDRPRQAQILRDLGCRYAQGFYFAPPMDAEALEQMLSRSTISGWAAAGRG